MDKKTDLELRRHRDARKVFETDVVTKHLEEVVVEEELIVPVVKKPGKPKKQVEEIVVTPVEEEMPVSSTVEES